MSHFATLFFEPLDVLVFRDHRPFMAGQHFLARSVFPLPSVFFGALRTALFERAGVRFGGEKPFEALTGDDPALLGDADKPGALHLRGPLLAYRTGGETSPQLLLPWPADLDRGPKERPDDPCQVRRQPRHSGPEPGVRVVYPVYPRCVGESVALRWCSQGEFHKLDTLVKSERVGKPDSERLLLTQAGAVTYANAAATGEPSIELLPEHYVEEKAYLTKERRTGIMRTRAEDTEDPLTVEESMLYSVETWRLASGAGFVVDVSLADEHRSRAPRLRELLDELNGAALRLGGKGHLARVTCYLDGPSPWSVLRQELPKGESPRGQKIWCLTPSLIDPSRAGVKAALGRVLRLGGVNLRPTKDRSGRRRPKGPRPLIGALAPGSVLFLDAQRNLDDAIRDAEARGSEHGHHHQAGYGLHFTLPYPLPA